MARTATLIGTIEPAEILAEADLHDIQPNATPVYKYTPVLRQLEWNITKAIAARLPDTVAVRMVEVRDEDGDERWTGEILYINDGPEILPISNPSSIPDGLEWLRSFTTILEHIDLPALIRDAIQNARMAEHV